MTNSPETAEVAINAQYIKDISLEVPHAPAIFTKLTTQPQIGVDLNIDVNKLADKDYEITLNLKINADINKEKLFIFELSYAAACMISVPEDKLEPILFIEIPKLIFPYARQIVSSNLANANLPPLMLSPVDFAAIYRSKKEQTIKTN